MQTEREKMVSSKPYNASDAELVALRMRARSLTRRLNSSSEDQLVERTQIIRELFALVETPITIEPPFYCDYGLNIVAGKNVFINFGCVILDCAKVVIGSNVLFGPNVQIYTATHPLDPVERASGIESSKPITIGDNVWLGGGVIVCPGVTIGSGSTIGAGSVVTKDIPANVIAAGNPCIVIRTI